MHEDKNAGVIYHIASTLLCKKEKKNNNNNAGRISYGFTGKSHLYPTSCNTIAEHLKIYNLKINLYCLGRIKYAANAILFQF